MNFKDQVSVDLENTFFNINEFAEWHELEGRQTLVVVDEDSFKEFSSTMELENAMQGIFQSALTVYVKSSDFKKPAVGDRINLDGHYYFVIGVSESAGLLKIDLAAYES